MGLTVRIASSADLAALPAIEFSGDAMFAERGIIFPPGPSAVETAISHGAGILVAGDPPVAFAAVIDLDGHPHLEQISVRADQTRNGIGSLLLDEVVRRHGPGLTLLTFRDVPWNGPWYSRHGFAEFPEASWGPMLRDHWQAEIDAGLHGLGPRLAMHVSGLPSRYGLHLTLNLSSTCHRASGGVRRRTRWRRAGRGAARDSARAWPELCGRRAADVAPDHGGRHP